MNPLLRIMNPRTKAVLSYDSCQAQFREAATLFETEGRAERAANDAIGHDKQWKIEPLELNGSKFYVVKTWPKAKASICAERRWAVFTKPQSRRANGCEEC